MHIIGIAATPEFVETPALDYAIGLAAGLQRQLVALRVRSASIGSRADDRGIGIGLVGIRGGAAGAADRRRYTGRQ